MRFSPQRIRLVFGSEHGTATAKLSAKLISRSRVEYRPLEGFVFAVTPFNFA